MGRKMLLTNKWQVKTLRKKSERFFKYIYYPHITKAPINVSVTFHKQNSLTKNETLRFVERITNIPIVSEYITVLANHFYFVLC